MNEDFDTKNAELDARFDESVKAIGDGIDRLKRDNAALHECLAWAVRQIPHELIETQAAWDRYDACNAILAKARGEQS